MAGCLLAAPAEPAAAAGTAAAAADEGPTLSSPEGTLGSCRPAGDPLEALLARNLRFSAAWRRAWGATSAPARLALLQEAWQVRCAVDPAALARGQEPWAAVLSCADSRVAPELIFASGFGELFEVRCAGNTAFSEGIASLEYAVAVLGVPLIVVMGHSGCGAVTAAMNPLPALSPSLEELLIPIRSVLEPGDTLSAAIRRHAAQVAQQLRVRSDVLARAAAAGRLRIQATYFDIASGRVSLV